MCVCLLLRRDEGWKTSFVFSCFVADGWLIDHSLQIVPGVGLEGELYQSGCVLESCKERRTRLKVNFEVGEKEKLLREKKDKQVNFESDFDKFFVNGLFNLNGAETIKSVVMFDPNVNSGQFLSGKSHRKKERIINCVSFFSFFLEVAFLRLFAQGFFLQFQCFK